MKLCYLTCTLALMLANPTTALAQKATAKGGTARIEQKKDDRKDESRVQKKDERHTDRPRQPRFGPMQNLKSELASINQRLDLLTGEVTELRTDVDAIQSSLQSQINAIQTTLATQQSQITGVQGKVTTLEGAVASFQASETANTATITALQAAIASLEELMASTQATMANNAATDAASQEALYYYMLDIQAWVETHHSMILSLKHQQGLLADVMTNITRGNCGTDQAMQSINSGGMVSCTSASTSAGALSTLTVEVWGSLAAGSNTMSAHCPAGYVTTSAGFWTPTYQESVPYVSNVNYTWFYWDIGGYWPLYYPTPNSPEGGSTIYKKAEEVVTKPVPLYSYLERSPISVTSSQAWPDRATAQATYTPQTDNGAYYWAVYASCLKIQ